MRWVFLLRSVCGSHSHKSWKGTAALRLEAGELPEPAECGRERDVLAGVQVRRPSKLGGEAHHLCGRETLGIAQPRSFKLKSTSSKNHLEAY